MGRCLAANRRRCLRRAQHSYDDVDALWQRAVDAGAKVSQRLQDMFWGDRHGEIIDPFGHKWALAQRVRDVSPEEVRVAAAALFAVE
jgi:PhnB protein